MIDLIFNFPNEAAAIAALPQLRSDDAWDASRVFRCTTYTESEPVTDTENGITVTQTTLPGFVLWVCLPERDEALEAVDECILVAQRDPAVILKADWPPGAKVSPVIAGSAYDFGKIGAV